MRKSFHLTQIPKHLIHCHVNDCVKKIIEKTLELYSPLLLPPSEKKNEPSLTNYLRKTRPTLISRVRDLQIDLE